MDDKLTLASAHNLILKTAKEKNANTDIFNGETKLSIWIVPNVSDMQELRESFGRTGIIPILSGCCCPLPNGDFDCDCKCP